MGMCGLEFRCGVTQSVTQGDDPIETELHREARRNGVLVSGGTWPQVIYCAPLRLRWCPNFQRGRGSGKGIGVGRY